MFHISGYLDCCYIAFLTAVLMMQRERPCPGWMFGSGLDGIREPCVCRQDMKKGDLRVSVEQETTLSDEQHL